MIVNKCLRRNRANRWVNNNQINLVSFNSLGLGKKAWRDNRKVLFVERNCEYGFIFIFKRIK